MTAPLITDLDAALAGAKARFDHADAPHDPDVLALIRAAEAARAALNTPPIEQPADAVAVLDRVIDDVCDGWMQGDPMPATERMVDRLTAHGYVLVKAPVDGDTLYGVPDWADAEEMLRRYTSWLHRKGQLTPCVGDDIAAELEDMVLHFLSEERETALIPDEPAPALPVDRAPAPAHLQPEFTDSGRALMPPLYGAGGRGEIAVYEAPAANHRLWVTVADYDSGHQSRVPVDLDGGWKFAEQLITLVRNYYTGDATPTDAAYAVTPLFGTVDGGK